MIFMLSTWTLQGFCRFLSLVRRKGLGDQGSGQFRVWGSVRTCEDCEDRVMATHAYAR